MQKGGSQRSLQSNPGCKGRRVVQRPAQASGGGGRAEREAPAPLAAAHTNPRPRSLAAPHPPPIAPASKLRPHRSASRRLQPGPRRCVQGRRGGLAAGRCGACLRHRLGGRPPAEGQLRCTASTSSLWVGALRRLLAAAAVHTNVIEARTSGRLVLVRSTKTRRAGAR